MNEYPVMLYRGKEGRDGFPAEKKIAHDADEDAKLRRAGFKDVEQPPVNGPSPQGKKRHSGGEDD